MSTMSTMSCLSCKQAKPIDAFSLIVGAIYASNARHLIKRLPVCMPALAPVLPKVNLFT